MSTINNFKVAMAGLLIGEETEEHTKYLTQKALKELLEKAGAHYSPKVNSNTTHCLKGRMKEAWEGSEKEKAISEVNEKRKEKANACGATATGAGDDEGTPAKKKKGKTTQSESKKILEPIMVLDLPAFLAEYKLDWTSSMETADFTKEKTPIEERTEEIIRKRTPKAPRKRKSSSTDSDEAASPEKKSKGADTDSADAPEEKEEAEEKEEEAEEGGNDKEAEEKTEETPIEERTEEIIRKRTPRKRKSSSTDSDEAASPEKKSKGADTDSADAPEEKEEEAEEGGNDKEAEEKTEE